MTVQLETLLFKPRGDGHYLIHKCSDMPEAETIAEALRACEVVGAQALSMPNGDVGNMTVVQVPSSSEEALKAAGVAIERPKAPEVRGFEPAATAPDRVKTPRNPNAWSLE